MSTLPPPRLTVRSDFLRAATGSKGHVAFLSVQTKPQEADGPARVGFTASKKVGNAVERNRAKRRLREAVRIERDLGLRPGHDYVIVARQDVVTARWPALVSGLRAAIRKAHAGKRRPTEPAARQPRNESASAVTHDGRQ